MEALTSISGTAEAGPPWSRPGSSKRSRSIFRSWAVMAARDRLGSAALLVGSLLVSLALGEVALRLADYSYNPLDIRAGDDQDRRLYHAFEDGHFEYDPELLWAPRKGHDIFNRDGFRGTCPASNVRGRFASSP
jgi:hypothetical protein